METQLPSKYPWKSSREPFSRGFANQNLRTTALEVPRHSEDGDNAGSQPNDIMPDSQSGIFCTRSEISHFENESDKERS